MENIEKKETESSVSDTWKESLADEKQEVKILWNMFDFNEGLNDWDMTEIESIIVAKDYSESDIKNYITNYSNIFGIDKNDLFDELSYLSQNLDSEPDLFDYVTWNIDEYKHNSCEEWF